MNLRGSMEHEAATGLLASGIDYTVYRLGPLEAAAAFLCGGLAGFAVGWIFYEHLILSALAAAASGFVAVRAWRKHRLDKRRGDLLLQFRELLESLSTSQGAGSNARDSFLSAEGDMERRYGGDAYICQELRRINGGVNSNMKLEELLLDLGRRSGLPDIISFANVFDTCYRKGGNPREVIKDTHRILSDKIGISLDINTAVMAQKTEQNMMMAMPVVLVFLLKNMGSDVINLTSPVGRLSTTVAVVMFAAAYVVSRKMLDIKV